MKSDEAESNTAACVPVQYVRDFPFPQNHYFHKENIEAALDVQPRDTDIFISTFPKCGTNWIKYIVYTILTKGKKPLNSLYELFYENAPLLEISGVTMIDDMPDPRPLQCHLPYHLIPKNPKAKYIYLLRNPKDTLVSFYYFVMDVNQVYIDFDTYFENFMKGMVSYGDYFDHVLSWYKHKDDLNVLFLSYEQLKANTRDQILNIAKFLGNSYHKALLEDDGLIELVLKQTSFDEMKKFTEDKKSDDLQTKMTKCSLEQTNHQDDVNLLKMFRKGVVGDWKNHLSSEQNRIMEERMLEKFGETDINQMFDP